MRVTPEILIGAARPALQLASSMPVERVRLRRAEISAGWLDRAMAARTRPDVSLLISFPDGSPAAFVPPGDPAGRGPGGAVSGNLRPKGRTTRRQ